MHGWMDAHRLYPGDKSHGTLQRAPDRASIVEYILGCTPIPDLSPIEIASLDSGDERSGTGDTDSMPEKIHQPKAIRFVCYQVRTVDARFVALWQYPERPTDF